MTDNKIELEKNILELFNNEDYIFGPRLDESPGFDGKYDKGKRIFIFTRGDIDGNCPVSIVCTVQVCSNYLKYNSDPIEELVKNIIQNLYLKQSYNFFFHKDQ